jgi:hypothetical protein
LLQFKHYNLLIAFTDRDFIDLSCLEYLCLKIEFIEGSLSELQRLKVGCHRRWDELEVVHHPSNFKTQEAYLTCFI